MVAWGDLMYAGEHIAAVSPNGAVDGKGIPMRSWNGALYYVADNIARQGLYRLNGFVRTGDSAYTRVVRAFDAKLRAMARPVGDAWFFPWPFSYSNEHLVTPWYNAMTQGLVLSFFSRMYEVYGDPDDLAAAGHVFASFRDHRSGRRRRGWRPSRTTTCGWSTTPAASPSTCSMRTCGRPSASTTTGDSSGAMAPTASTRSGPRSRAPSRRCATTSGATGASGRRACTRWSTAPRGCTTT